MNMPDLEKTIKGLEALYDSMHQNQCYACSYEFIDVAQEFGTNIVADAVDLLKAVKDEKKRGDHVSFKNGAWHDANLDPPPDNALALGVRRLSDSKDYCFVRYEGDGRGWHIATDDCMEKADDNDVLFWMPLPKIPSIGDNVIIYTKWIRRQEVDP